LHRHRVLSYVNWRWQVRLARARFGTRSTESALGVGRRSLECATSATARRTASASSGTRRGVPDSGLQTGERCIPRLGERSADASCVRRRSSDTGTRSTVRGHAATDFVVQGERTTIERVAACTTRGTPTGSAPEEKAKSNVSTHASTCATTGAEIATDSRPINASIARRILTSSVNGNADTMNDSES